ncbi:MAG TPA: GNAT family N-acetyltransferase [Candidatus Nanoarchaeia archaeon]|nr:GNAT family N-acetyltransferase [Candidatus Nanoarchaeia archaeon]
MKIRKTNKRDSKKISDLHKLVLNKVNRKKDTDEFVDYLLDKYDSDYIKKKLDKGEVFCLINKNKVIGTVGLEDNIVGKLYIHPKYLGKGLGNKLMDFIEDYARKNGKRKLKLFPTNYAYKFYRKLGYRKVKSFIWKTDQFKRRVYIMEKKLKNKHN